MTAKEALTLAEEYNKRRPGLELEDIRAKIESRARTGWFDALITPAPFEENIKILEEEGYKLIVANLAAEYWTISWEG